MDPQFGRSADEAGLQIADSVAYCTGRFLNNKRDFHKHWLSIYPKIQTGKDGRVEGYGLTVFPET